MKTLFGLIHQRERMSAAEFQRRLQAARQAVLHAGSHDVPASRHAQNLAKRLEKYGESYFTFVTTPGVEPTNNLAEQAIRFVVIDRLITQGTRGDRGDRWCERVAACTARTWDSVLVDEHRGTGMAPTRAAGERSQASGLRQGRLPHSAVECRTWRKPGPRRSR